MCFVSIHLFAKASTSSKEKTETPDYIALGQRLHVKVDIMAHLKKAIHSLIVKFEDIESRPFDFPFSLSLSPLVRFGKYMCKSAKFKQTLWWMTYICSELLPFKAIYFVPFPFVQCCCVPKFRMFSGIVTCPCERQSAKNYKSKNTVHEFDATLFSSIFQLIIFTLIKTVLASLSSLCLEQVIPLNDSFCYGYKYPANLI